MAAFNKAENEAVVSTGLSNSSRGLPVDQSLGSLFEGVGDTLKNTLTAYDESTRVKIQMAADEAVNGPNGAVAEATGQLPPGAEAGVQSIAALKAGLDQGTISQVQFDTAVARHAKRIRATVPNGYGPIVEQALSAAVGSSTANQARQTEMAAADAAARSADAGYNKMRSWMDQEGNNKLFYTDNVKAYVEHRTGMKIQDIVNNPTPETFAVLQQGVMMQRGIETQREMDEAAIKSKQTVTDSEGSRIVDGYVRDSFNRNVNVHYNKYLNAMNAASDPNSPSGAQWDGTEAENVLSVWRVTRQDAIMGLEAKLGELNISGEKRDEMRKRLTTQLDAIEYYISKSDTGMLTSIANQMARNKDAGAAELLRSDSKAMGIAIMKQAGYPDAIIDTVARKGDPQLSALADKVEASAIGVLTGKRSVLDTFGVMENYIPKEQMGQYSKEFVDKLAEVLNTDKNDAKGVALAAKNLFDEQNDKLIASLPMERRVEIFQRLMSPAVINKLIESQDKDALNAASRWGENQLRVVARRAMANMEDGAKYRYDIDITFDGKKFVAAPRQRQAGETMYNGTPTYFDNIYTQTAVDAVTEMNQYLDVMKPLWEAQGKDVGTNLGFLMQRNINDIQHEPPVLKQMMDGVYGFLSGGKQAGMISGTAQASTPAPNEKVATAAELSPNPTPDELEDLPSAKVMKTAAKQLGMNERDQRSALKEYLANGGVNLDPATTAWCAAYVNATLAQNGLKGTGSNLARSFLQYGEEVEQPREGDIVVFTRGKPGSGQGHVGFFKGYDDNGNILVLGGNQGDSVSVKSYDKKRLLGYRRIPGHNRNIAPDQLQVAAN